MIFLTKVSLLFCSICLISLSGRAEDKNEKTIAPISDFAPEGTELFKYQKRLYNFVGSKWKTKVSSNSLMINKNEKVIFHFTVRPTGEITNIELVHGDPQSLLALMSLDSIKQSSEVFEFSDELLRESPNGFKWELSFKIY